METLGSLHSFFNFVYCFFLDTIRGVVIIISPAPQRAVRAVRAVPVITFMACVVSGLLWGLGARVSGSAHDPLTAAPRLGRGSGTACRVLNYMASHCI